MVWTSENDISYYLDYNLKAQNALSISMFGKGFKNSCKGYTCCHIYGKEFNRDWKNYTCIANIVLIPQPLQSLTDYHSTIMNKLKNISFRLYNWKPLNKSHWIIIYHDEEFNLIQIIQTPLNFERIYRNKIKDYYNSCIAKDLNHHLI